MKAEIYSKPTCPHCVRAKDLLKAKGYEYTEYVLGVNGVTKEAIEERIGNGYVVRTVPQIFLDDKHIGGCSDLAKLLETNLGC